MKKLLPILAFAALWVGFFSLPILETGCGSPSSRVVQVQSLKAVGQTAEAAVALSAQLYRDHKITDAQANAVIALYDNKFQPAYRVAVSAVQANLDSIASPDLISLAAQLSALVTSYQTLSK